MQLRFSIIKINFTLYTPSFISQIHLISVLKSVSALGGLFQTSAEMSVLLTFSNSLVFKELVGKSVESCQLDLQLSCNTIKRKCTVEV